MSSSLGQRQGKTAGVWSPRAHRLAWSSAARRRVKLSKTCCDLEITRVSSLAARTKRRSRLDANDATPLSDGSLSTRGPQLVAFERHCETHAAHQAQCVPFRDRTLPQKVIERHLAVDHVFPEVDQAQSICQRTREFTQGEIVCRDRPKRVALEQLREDPTGSDPSLTRVRAVKDLVQQEEHGDVAFRGLHYGVKFA